ncbi:hypothetical protein BBK82_42125 [Lentzea guizhouensis]|uniref:Uncharacterized protein n=1 Tax=Lentzea guizhouensis TaxID=1586287 RepID=A0A1B2HV70_9PSEU|nr:hypothetical protein BBK82_42125 [Lentzea guizhouensis]
MRLPDPKDGSTHRSWDTYVVRFAFAAAGTACSGHVARTISSVRSQALGCSRSTASTVPALRVPSSTTASVAVCASSGPGTWKVIGVTPPTISATT